MDVFAWSNLTDVHASAAIVPWTDVSIGVEYRYARLWDTRGEWIGGYLSAIGSAPQLQSKELGHELDVGLRWRPWLPVELSAGYSALLLGDGARSVLAAEARGDRQPDGSYASAELAHYTYLQAKMNVP
jgi:hypothetical protein